MRFVAGLSTQRPLLFARPDYVGFMVDKVALGLVFL
jgi:hypothetical protein